MSELIDATIFAIALVAIAFCVSLIATRYELKELEEKDDSAGD